MGFISSATTVNVEATLTFAGKKRLYQMIEGDGEFITKFTLGDSDSNYQAIPTTGPLDTGFVPEGGDHRPFHRSYVLYQGTYRPGVPVIFIDNEPAPTFKQFSIGGNATGNFIEFNVTTEWPTNDPYVEEYGALLKNPTQLSNDAFNRAFTIAKTGTAQFKLTFTGNLTLPELAQLIGESNDSKTDIIIEIKGSETRRKAFLNVELVT